MNLKRRIDVLEAKVGALQSEVDRLSKVRGGSWYENMHYERTDKRIKLLTRRKRELWERYFATSLKQGKKDFPLMWDEYREVKAQIEALEAEYLGEGNAETQRRNRSRSRDGVDQRSGRVDIPETLQKITGESKDAPPDQPQR